MSSRTISWDNLNTCGPIEDMDKILVDGWQNYNLLFKMLNDKRKKTLGGGSITSWPIEKAIGQGGSWAGGIQTITMGDPQILDKAQLPAAYYYAQMMITHREEKENRGPDAIMNLMTVKYNNMRATIEYYLNRDLWTDGSSASPTVCPIIGVAAGVKDDPTSGTYATITRDTTAATDFWKNQTESMTLASFDNLKYLQTLWQKCTDEKIHPDIIVTEPNVYDVIWNLCDARQRLGNEMAKNLGFDSVDFNGVPIVCSKTVTTNKLYMFNTDFMDLEVDPTDDMAPTPFILVTGDQINIRKKYITWRGQLRVTNPRYQGVKVFS